MDRRHLIDKLAFPLALVLCRLATGPAVALDTTFAVQPGGTSRIVFVSKAPMESFEGKTSQVSGRIVLDPGRLADSSTVRLEVAMASLDTGIELRNRHMRENHLHCDRFPTAVFEGGRLTALSGTSLAEGKTVTGTITGTMTLHGRTRPLAAPFEMTLESGALHVVARFRIKLADYEIPRPQFLVMKLDESQSVTVDLRARPQP